MRFSTAAAAACALAFAAVAIAQDACTPLAEPACFSTGCSWCVCSAVPSSCQTYETASGLPHSVFNCGNATRPDCGASTTNNTCMTNVGCAWCASKGVGQNCVNVQKSGTLDPSVWSCTWSDGKNH